jgi:hypothetical protein
VVEPGEALRPVIAQGVEGDDAMALGQRAHPLQRAPLALRHRRQVGLDVGDAVAVR